MNLFYGVQLSLGFDILGQHGFANETLEVHTFDFAGGEPHVKITPPSTPVSESDLVIISSRYKSFQDLGKIALTVDALRRLGFKNISLILPYLPAARQDRVMVEGESLSLKVVADFINQLGLHDVIIWDAHSEVALALIDNVRHIDNYSFINRVMADIRSKDGVGELNLVSPDAGSNKKIFKLSDYLKINTDTIIKCDKHRDVNNGKIDYIQVYAKPEDISGKDLLIVDDICDGGYTFVLAAKALKEMGAGRIYLAVTHGIFSKGFEELRPLFSGIYTTDSFDGERDSLVTELPYM